MPIDAIMAKNFGLIEQIIFHHNVQLNRLQLDLLKSKATR